MNVYPYKIIKAGQFTKYIISIVENGNVLVEHYFKNKRKSQKIFETQKAIKSSDLPKNIKEVSLWAKYEAKSLCY